MASKRRAFHRSRATARDGRGASPIGLRPVPEAPGCFELVHPRGARERDEDIEEVLAMIEAGEVEIARDELLWLVEECREFILAHRLLGELAAEAGDWRLARGHFGYAWQLGCDAIPKSGLSQGGARPGKPSNDLRGAAGGSGTLPYSQPANRAFLESGKGLVYCHQQQGSHDMARGVIDQLLKFDPSDPLDVRMMRLSAPGLNIVELTPPPPQPPSREPSP